MKRLEDLNRIEQEVTTVHNNTKYVRVKPFILVISAIVGIAIIGVLVKVFVFPSSNHVPQYVNDNNTNTNVNNNGSSVDCNFTVTVGDADEDNANSITDDSSENPSAELVTYKDDDEYRDIPEATRLMPEGLDNLTVFGSEYLRDAIRSIQFLIPCPEVPNTAWDISETKNGTIMAWVERKGNLYDLFIASKNAILANEDCSGLFCGYKNTVSISFGTFFDTSKTTKMNAMFKDCEKLITLDLSTFNMKNVVSIVSMFEGCKSLTDLNTTSFIQAPIENSENVFLGCKENTVKMNKLNIRSNSVPTSDQTSEVEITVDDPKGTMQGETEDTESNLQALEAGDPTNTDAVTFSIGDEITLGIYPQTIDGDELPIIWTIIAIEGDKGLLIAKNGLDIVKYNVSYDKVTWKTCTLREWLNETFYNQAFASNEQETILISQIDNGKSQGYTGYGDGGSRTEDRVFLLSYKEAFTLLKNDQERKCIITPYAGGKIQQNDADSSQNYAGWWLRSPGVHQYYAMQVLDDGTEKSTRVNYEGIALRPAMWVYLKGKAVVDQIKKG